MAFSTMENAMTNNNYNVEQSVRDEDPEEGEIVDDFEYIISSDEALNVQKRIEELESKNEEIEKIKLISASYDNNYNYNASNAFAVNSRDLESQEYFHNFSTKKHFRGKRISKDSSTDSSIEHIPKEKKRTRKKRRAQKDITRNRIKPTFYNNTKNMQSNKFKQQILKGTNKKNNYIKHENRAYFKYKKYVPYQSDSHENSSNESTEENGYKKHQRRMNNKLKKLLQNTQCDKNKMHSNMCSSLADRLTCNNGKDRAKKEEENSITAELSDNMAANTAVDTIASKNLNTIVIDDDTKDIDSDSQEEGELRLIALKSAMIQRHLKRKKRNAELAYSPTAFDEMLTIVEASKSPNDIDVELEDMVSEMEISPTTSPRLTPVEFVEENSAINNKPVDMDIANSESDNEAVIYSGTNVDWPVPVFDQNIENCNVDIPTAMPYPIDYSASLQYGLFTPDIRYHLTSIPPPPLPPMFSECMEPIAPPPIFSDVNDIPPPPPPFHMPIEKQAECESSLKQITYPVLSTIDNVLEFKNITINNETDAKEDKTDSINTNTNSISKNSTAEQQHCEQNSLEDDEEADDEEEEVALRALLLSKFQTSKYARKPTHKNGLLTTQSKAKSNAEEAAVVAPNVMDKQKQSILKEAVRRLKMKSENAELYEKSNEQELDNNSAAKSNVLTISKVQKPKKVVKSLDSIIRERIEQLMLEEEMEMKTNAITKENEEHSAVIETDAHNKNDKETAVAAEQIVHTNELKKEFVELTTAAKNLTANNSSHLNANTNEIKLQTTPKPLVAPVNHEQQLTIASSPSTSSSSASDITSTKEQSTNELIKCKQILQPKAVSSTVSNCSNALNSNKDLLNYNKVSKLQNGKNLLNGFKSKASNAVAASSVSETKLNAAPHQKQNAFTNIGSAFVPIVTKIVKPNKVINTNMNLKRKNVNNAAPIDSKQTKLTKDLNSSNETFKPNKTASPTAANTRLLSATDVAHRVVNKIVINLQSSESDKSDTEDGNDTETDSCVNSSKTCRDAARRMDNEYFDIQSPLSLAMGSRSTTPSRVNSPNASLESVPTASAIKTNISNDIFEQKIDDFLKNMREKVQTLPMLQTKPIANVVSTDKDKADTPLAVRHLPIAAQREYSRLRERMKALEKQKETSSHEITSSTTQPAAHKKTTVESTTANTCKPTTTLPPKAIGQTTHSNKAACNNNNNNKSCQTSLSNEKLTQNVVASINNAVDVKSTLVKAVLLKNANTATAQTLPKATKATNSVQDAKKLNILRAHENSYNKTGVAILNIINSSLGLVNDVKTAKIAEIKYEQEIAALKAELDRMNAKLKLEKEKLEKLRPEVCRSNELLTSMRQKRSKLFKAAHNLGKVMHGDKYSLNCELNKEIKLKFNNLAKEIKVVNSINTKNVETLDVNWPTMNRTVVTKSAAANVAQTKVVKCTAQKVEESKQQILPAKRNAAIACNKPANNAKKSAELVDIKKNCSPLPSKNIASNAKVACENKQTAVDAAKAIQLPNSKEQVYISLQNVDKKPEDVSQAAAIHDEKAMANSSTTHAANNEDEDNTNALPNYVSSLTQFKNSERKLDPFAIVCPYELMGECDDTECHYIHLDKTNNC